MSDVRENPKTYGITLGYSTTDTGDSTYQTVSLGLSYRPWKWLAVTGNIPYTIIGGEETIVDDLGGGQYRTNRFTYDSNGFGDISLMAWADLFQAFKDPPEETECNPPIGPPALYVGMGLKLPTGPHDYLDRKKYDYDRANSNGEYSDSDGIYPSYFQLGTGTLDGLFGVYCQQRFGRFVPHASLTYTLTGGENSVGYERGDSFGWSVGTKFLLMNLENSRQFYIQAGLSGVYIPSEDVDHSEDNQKAFSQRKGKVEDTDGAFSYWDIGVGYDLTENLTVSATAMFPLSNDSSSSTSNSFDSMFGLSCWLRF